MFCCCRQDNDHKESPPVSPKYTKNHTDSEHAHLLITPAPPAQVAQRIPNANQNNPAHVTSQQQQPEQRPVSPSSVQLTDVTEVTEIMAANLEKLVSRLEAVTTRLENVSGSSSAARKHFIIFSLDLFKLSFL